MYGKVHSRPPVSLAHPAGGAGGPPEAAPRARAARGKKIAIYTYVKIHREKNFKYEFCGIIFTVLESQNISHMWFGSQLTILRSKRTVQE